MKKLAAITFTSMVLLLATAMAVGAADSVEVRGKVATEGATWTADDFAGFYYDLDDDIKTEELTTTISEGNKLLEPDGVTYTSTAQANEFEFEEWGTYNVIGFFADKYFAGYIDDPNVEENVLFDESEDENVLADEQLLKILMDNDDERTVTSGTPLAMEEGYELAIQSIDIDGNKVYLELSKDGAVVDSKVISPSADNAGMKDKTYYYKKDIGDSKDVVIVAAHFKNAFRGADQNLATVDGLWQLSDTPQDVSENTEYDKMTIQTVTANTITMNNEDNDITLSKNKDITLMPGVSIKTADSDDDALRYYIYKEATIEGEGEVAKEENETAVVTPVNATEKTVEEAKEAVEEANKTVEEAEQVVEEAKEEVVEAEAKAEEAAEVPANQTPGFGSIFALTGLLAVAYLVLSRRD